MLGLDINYDAFDTDITVHINTAMMTLQQLGVGPDSGLFITGLSETWDQFFQPGEMLEASKTYIYLRVRLVFDPPSNSFVLSSMEKTCEMLEWRLKGQARFFDAAAGKYVRRTPEKLSDESTDNVSTASSGTQITVWDLLSSDEKALETGLYPVHIERDGITPLDDIGQNTVMNGN